MTTNTPSFPDDLLADYQIAEPVMAFLTGKETMSPMHEMFPFGVVYETLEWALAQLGNPAEGGSAAGNGSLPCRPD